MTPAALVCCAEQDRLEVRRETNEQDKHLDVISDALNDLQRIGEVSLLALCLLQACERYHPYVCCSLCTCVTHCHTRGPSVHTLCVQAMGSEVKYQDAIIERNQAHVSTADTQLRNLSNQAVKDHRLNYTRR